MATSVGLCFCLENGAIATHSGWQVIAATTPPAMLQLWALPRASKVPGCLQKSSGLLGQQAFS
jgi:hypothetical protein